MVFFQLGDNLFKSNNTRGETQRLKLKKLAKQRQKEPPGLLGEGFLCNGVLRVGGAKSGGGGKRERKRGGDRASCY